MKHSGEKIVKEMTMLIEEMKEYDIKSASMLHELVEMKSRVLLTAANIDRSKLPTLADLLNLYLEYSDYSECIHKKIEHCCQLMLMNPELMTMYIPIYGTAMVNDTFEKIDSIMSTIASRRMNSLELRKWVVQQQIMRGWRAK